MFQLCSTLDQISLGTKNLHFLADLFKISAFLLFSISDSGVFIFYFTKHCLVRTMLERAYRLSSSRKFFPEECTRLENVSFQPVFLSNKLQDELKITEKKPSIVNQQRVVYQFKCSFCDENYIGFTMRHQHERCEEHKFNSSSIKKHFTKKTIVCLIISIITLKSYENVRLNITVQFMKCYTLGNCHPL